MKDFFKGLLLLPFKMYGSLIPSLPDSINDLNTLQRLWLTLITIYFYGFSLFVFFTVVGYGFIAFFGHVDGFFTLTLGYLAPLIFYFSVALIFKALSMLFGFIFEKEVKKIKYISKSASEQINSQLILRYLLILLVIVIIVVILIGAFG